MKQILCAAVSTAALMFSGAANAQTEGYYQTPALSSDLLVFSSEGDLWRADPTGGTAVRLTTHPETEMSPKLSPGGSAIAFEGNYDGAQEIYLISVTGGEPKRLTFENGGVSVRGWLDENHVLYRTSNLPGTIPMIFRSVNVLTGEVEDIPLAGVNQAALGASGNKLVFTRYGIDLFNDNVQQYRGGRMSQLWTWTMGSTEEAVRLAADFGAPIRSPMVSDDRIYFVSDKSGADNIWSVAMDGSDPVQHTELTSGLIKSPYVYNDQIVYQSGADLFVYDITSGETTSPSIYLMSDSDYKRDRWLAEPLTYLSSANITSDGKGAVMTARGHFVTAYTKDRRRIEYAVPDGTRAREAITSGDGESVYVILDRGVRGEVWKYPLNGVGEPSQITSGSDTYVWQIWAKPDSEDFLWSDKRGRLFYYDVSAKKATEIAKTASSNDSAYGDFDWSSDGRYMSYTGYDGRDMPIVFILDTKTMTTQAVTSGKFESFSAAFSEDDDWLYFISNRHFDASPGSPWGDRNMGPAFQDRGQIFALQLNPEASFPWVEKTELDLQADDEKEDEDKDEDDKDKKDEADKKDDKPSKIVLDGVASRLWQVPIENGSYYSLAATGSNLLILADAGSSNEIKKVEITSEKPELTSFTRGVNGFDLSADGKTLLVAKGRGSNASFYLVNPDKAFPSDADSSKVRIADWKLRINPSDEWVQMAEDAWRLHRDFAYDPNLRSVDWDAVGEKYLPLANRVGHRTELNDLLGQMTSNLGILHSQVRTGEVPSDKESGSAAYLGATYKAVSGGLEITHIYQAEADRPDTLGPLLGAGKDVKVGDVITAIDGRSVASIPDLDAALAMKAGDQVLLEYRRGSEAMKEIVVPASSREIGMLRYQDWVELNRRKVAEESKGEFGYLHLRAMGAADVETFARDFFEHFDKDGVIIDVRGNRGGNVDSILIASLLRKAWAFWGGLEGGPVYTNMQQAFRGHLIILIDEGTYSDGETFSAGIKALDIAPLLGTRTAGAGIWLSDRNRLVDGGQARVAEYAQYGLDGRWLAEGLGVGPDIEVSNPPFASYQGEDAQLEAAVKWLEEKVAAEPIPQLVPQPLPPVGTTGRDVK